MRSDLKRTLLIDAAIVAALVVLALVLAPGVAIVGIVALLILILGAVSFLFGEFRARRRRKRQRTQRAALSGRGRTYTEGRNWPPGGNVAPRPTRSEGMSPRSRTSRDRPARRQPPGAGPRRYE